MSKLKAFLFKKTAPIFLFCTFFSVGFTLFLMRDPTNADVEKIISLVGIDLLLLLVLFFLIVIRLTHKWVILRKENSRLHFKVVCMFGVVSLIPTSIVTAFSCLFFNYGIQSWFNSKITAALENSVQVADAYLQENMRNIIRDTLSVVAEIYRAEKELFGDYELFKQFLVYHAEQRKLASIAIIKDEFNTPTIILSTNTNLVLPDNVNITALREATTQDVFVYKDGRDNKVKSILKLENSAKVYLLLTKFIDDRVLHHVEKTRGAALSYHLLKSNIIALQLKFFLVFLLFSILLLLLAMWMGVDFSHALVTPIMKLVRVTQEITKGNLEIRVKESDSKDEIAVLEKAFNTMIFRLNLQSNNLLEINKVLHERKIFIETVINSLTSGVIVINSNYQITLFNNASQKFFLNPHKIIGQLVSTVIPELQEALETIYIGSFPSVQQITIMRDEEVTILMLKVIPISGLSIGGYILNFDDITKLIEAQKASTWTEIAQKIAHEIKNPITPIYLAISLIEKKFINNIQDSESEIFLRYFKIIKKNTEQISRIVNDFTNFARMPGPTLCQVFLDELLEDCILSNKILVKELIYDLQIPRKNIAILGDEQQLSCVVTNLLKNAREAISSLGEISKGKITICVITRDSTVDLIIKDNGPGFSAKVFNKIGQPYVTTRKAGRGLGLAIVKKIIDEHNGKITFKNLKQGGALIKISLLCYKAFIAQQSLEVT